MATHRTIARAPSGSATPTSATTTRRPRRYDSKWAIDYGEIGARPGARQARARRSASAPGHYARALEIGAGTGYFTLNLLRAGRDRPRDGHRHLARACCDRLEATAQRAGPRGRDRPRPTPSRCRSRTGRSTWCSVMRCSTTCRDSTGRCRSSIACSPRAARSRSWESRRATATGWRSCRSGSAGSSSRRGGGRMRAAPKANGAHPAPPAEHTYGAARGARGRAHLHARRPARARARRRLHGRARLAARSCSRTCTAGSCAGSSPTSTPETVPLRLAQVRLPQLPRAAVGRRPAARAAAPGEPLLQPAALRPAGRAELRPRAAAYTWPRWRRAAARLPAVPAAGRAAPDRGRAAAHLRGPLQGR